MVRTGYRSRLAVEQGKIYWREVGQGPALVLLHGGWRDGREWQELVDELSQSYRCYIPDLPGFGDSVLWSDQTVSIRTLVDSFTQYLDALNLKRVSLVGHGLGGWVAASYALRFPYAVHRLMLVEPEGVSTPDQKWMCRWGLRLSTHTSLWAGLLETIAPLGGVPGPLSRIKTLMEMRRQLMASPISGQLMYGRSLKAMDHDFLDNRLHQLLVPTLILSREGASLRQKVVVERYAALCHEAEVGLLPSLGDEKQEQILLKRIQAFMSQDVAYQAARQSQIHQAVAIAAQAVVSESASYAALPEAPAKARPAALPEQTEPAVAQPSISATPQRQPAAPIAPKTTRPAALPASSPATPVAPASIPAATPAAAMLQAMPQLPQ